MNLEWNCGSLRVLGVLQEIQLLSATEYILSLKDSAQIQLILNDFLETEYDLLLQLFKSSFYDNFNNTRINMYLDESLRCLFLDLLKNPTLNDLSYLNVFNNKLPESLLLHVMKKHIQVIMDLHDSNIKSAFQNYSIWINNSVDNYKFTKDLYVKLLKFCEQAAINYLFNASIKEHFKEWKFYLILMQTIVSRCTNECSVYIRKYFKTRLLQISNNPCKNAMLHLLLTARAATATTEDIDKNIDSYAKWYKQNIGEMKYVLDKEQFLSILTLMEECISYETELEYIEIYTQISIAPPVLCSKAVQSYKAKCKIHLTRLKNNIRPVEMYDSILIDDSD
ncbi:uncharacterized protein LOC119684192 isoform X2 [Teleopsis dalmanni]|nr:uncharacterized protein LOC119684192 isoform X2 [Teleopsis dalmanni]